MKKETDASRIIRGVYERNLENFKVSSSGKTATASCPFHDDTGTNLLMDLESGDFHCLICGEKGSFVDLKTKKDASELRRKTLLSVKDILNAGINHTSWIVSNLIPEGSIVLISAPPAHYKTWLALHIADCVSMGKEFLNSTTKKTTVYYVDRENPKPVIQQYIRMGTDPNNDTLKIWPLWGKKEPPQFLNEASSDGVYLELSKDKPLIIFDSFIRFFTEDIEENSSKDISKIMSFLRILTKEGATVLVLHHAGKSEKSEYRGSSDILGGVDVAYTIKKNDDSSISFNCIKNRFQKEDNINIKVNSDQSSMKFELEPDHDEENMKEIKNLISEFYKSNNRYPKQKEVIELIKTAEMDLSKPNMYQLLNKGAGNYWNIIQGAGHNAKLYKPISVLPFSNYIYTEKTEKLRSIAIPKPAIIFFPPIRRIIPFTGLRLRTRINKVKTGSA